MKSPKVSVSIIAYNHEKYIAACLDSVVSQVTNFDFEIVVSDDCSKDRTAEIIADYALRYPDLIKPIYRNPNLGSRRNAIKTIEACIGNYIALLEGDDFWVDNNKLQVQADYLDKNQDCAFCFTNNYTFYEDRPEKKEICFTEKNKPPEKFDVTFFIKHNTLIPNNTKMFRREVQPKDFPEYFFDSYSWDWTLHILQTKNSLMGYIDRVTLAYRRHPGAVYIAQTEITVLENKIKSSIGLDIFLKHKYDYRLRNFWWEYHQLAFAHLNDGRFGTFLYYYFKYLLIPEKPDDFKLKDDLWLLRKGLFRRNN